MRRTSMLRAALAVALLLGAGPVGRAEEPSAPTRSEETAHVELRVKVEPAERSIDARCALTLPASMEDRAASGVLLWLHESLEAEIDGPGWELERRENSAGMHSGVSLGSYTLLRIAPVATAGPARIRYRGRLADIVTGGPDASPSSAAGVIDEKGVSLSGRSYFVPTLSGVGKQNKSEPRELPGTRLLTFRMTVDLPEGYDAVSQGSRVEHEIRDGRRIVTWDCPQPMDEVYLIAARFHEYSRETDGLTAYAFLRQPDERLAATYLQSTAEYVAMYSELLGDYPYKKFALVENFLETGYGMPSFTLLGSTVIRLPFILYTSYPHEILHNWWGNSVFVEPYRGNWCEGLTAYLADFLMKEATGQGADYRRDTLKKYLNFASGGQDFPLAAFRSRHSEATQAVGYGKALMLFHMLRRDLGDAAFVAGLREFYRDKQFTHASYDDLRDVFSRVSKRDLAPFFEQWIDRIGAPELRLTDVEREGNVVRLTIEQVQEGPVYALSVPVAIGVQGVEEASVVNVPVTERRSVFDTKLPAPPFAVAIDPEFDLFRKLDRAEIPSSLGQVFGAERSTIVLPVKNREAWAALAAGWARRGDVDVVGEQDLTSLPADRAVWILGSENRHAPSVAGAFERHGAEIADVLRIDGEVHPREGRSFVLTAAHPSAPDLAIGWVGTDVAAAIPGLARKLPHYGKYSFLVFDGDAPTNIQKGQWTATDSPLYRRLDDGAENAPALRFPSRKPLTRPPSPRRR